MKKGILAILTVLTVFALMMMTGCPTPTSTKLKLYTVTFDANGGDKAPNAIKQKTEGEEISLPGKGSMTAPTGKPNFIGWSEKEDGTNPLTGKYTPEKDITLYAVWTAATTFTVTYNLNGGTGTAPTQAPVTSGTAINLAAGTGLTPPSGKTFGGWSTTASGSALTGSTYTVTANTTLYAVWTGGGGETPAGDFVTFSYANGTTVQVEFEAGETTWADILASAAYKAKGQDVWTDDTKVFANWKDQTGTDWTEGTTRINVTMTLTAKWLSTVFSGDTSAADVKKVYLENTNYIVYEFDLGTATPDLTKITKITADYGLSEKGLDVYKGNGRPWRAFGPYFFDDTNKIEQTYDTDKIRKFYGDFMLDDGGAFAARLDGTASLPATFNKFHSYMVVSTGSWDTVSNGTTTGSSAVPTADTWFTTTYILDPADDNTAVGSGNYTYGKTLRLLQGVLTDGKDGEVQVLPAGISKQKVYFAIGLTRANAGSGKDKSGTQSPWDSGLISLVKNVKLTYDGVEKTGTLASLSTSATAPDPNRTARIVANGYVDPILFSWVGAPTAPVVIPQDPGYVPPPPYTPATTKYEFSFTGFTFTTARNLLYTDAGKNTATDPARKRLIFNGNDVIFDLQANDYNDSTGEYGGGGFKILFADLNLPLIGSDTTADHRSYKKIILDTTLVETETGSAAGKQVIFANTGGGTNLTTVSNNDATSGGFYGTYIEVAAGANVFSFAPSALVDTAGFSVRVNNWSAANVPWMGTLTINKIIFDVVE